MIGTDNQYIMVHVTCPAEHAVGMAQLFVTKKAAACVNIIDNVHSIYRWQGEIQNDNESMMVIKTTASALDKLSQLIEQHHPYKLPEIIATPIVAGLPEYLNWVGTSTDQNESEP